MGGCQVMKRTRTDFKIKKDTPGIIFLILASFFFWGGDLSWAQLTSPEKGNSPKMWTFDTERGGTLPSNFSVGTLVDGRPAGNWQIINMKNSLHLLNWLERAEHTRIIKILQTNEAPSGPHVLAQLNHKAFVQDFNVLLIDETPESDFDLQVSFLPVAGKADMGGGLIWHARDHQNYYITRANPLEQNIRFYRVVNGVRHMLANFDHIISVKSWHTLQVLVRGNRFKILFDEQPVFDVQDETFRTGQIGLWTKADAVTYFDNLRLSVLR